MITELDFKLSVCLRRLVVKQKKDHRLIEAFSLNEPDEKARQELIAKVKIAMAYPRGTVLYKTEIENQINEVVALQSVELEGLIALAFLGKKQIVPQLLKSLREDQTKNTRRRIVASAALHHLTGQEIGSKFLFEEDLDFWEEWWEKNKSFSDNE